MTQDLQELRKNCLEKAREAVSESVDEDDYIIQAIRNLGELKEKANSLGGRIREWYGLYLPEVADEIRDNRALVEMAAGKSREELLQEFDIEESLGADMQEMHLIPLLEYADTVKRMYEMQDNLEEYLEQVMSTYCWNLQQVAGTKVGARLLAEAGSLKKLAMMPGSSIQLLGAEKALFRHLREGGKPPKHGHVFLHPLVQEADGDMRGKVSRAVADKIALACRADYFSERYIGEDMRKELEERFNG